MMEYYLKPLNLKYSEHSFSYCVRFDYSCSLQYKVINAYILWFSWMFEVMKWCFSQNKLSVKLYKHTVFTVLALYEICSSNVFRGICQISVPSSLAWFLGFCRVDYTGNLCMIIYASDYRRSNLPDPKVQKGRQQPFWMIASAVYKFVVKTRKAYVVQIVLIVLMTSKIKRVGVFSIQKEIFLSYWKKELPAGAGKNGFVCGHLEMCHTLHFGWCSWTCLVLGYLLVLWKTFR